MARQWMTPEGFVIDEEGEDEYMLPVSFVVNEDQAAVVVAAGVKRAARAPLRGIGGIVGITF